MIANNTDLLSLGIAIGKTGPVRPEAKINWVGQSSMDYADHFISGVNYKHADCDGNGTIDKFDSIPILHNYSQKHNKTEQINKATSTDPSLYFVMPSDKLVPGMTVNIPIMLGNNAIPVTNLYGMAYTINYNSLLIDSGSVNVKFDSTWMGTTGKNIISMQKDFWYSGQVELALTRTDNQNVSNYVQIGELSFVLKEDISSNASSQMLKFSFSDATAISNNEHLIPVNLMSDSVAIFMNASGIKYDFNKYRGSNINIYPNPAKEILYVEMENAQLQNINIFNSIGESVFNY